MMLDLQTLTAIGVLGFICSVAICSIAFKYYRGSPMPSRSTLSGLWFLPQALKSVLLTILKLIWFVGLLVALPVLLLRNTFNLTWRRVSLTSSSCVAEHMPALQNQSTSMAKVLCDSSDSVLHAELFSSEARLTYIQTPKSSRISVQLLDTNTASPESPDVCELPCRCLHDMDKLLSDSSDPSVSMVKVHSPADFAVVDEPTLLWSGAQLLDTSLASTECCQARAWALRCLDETGVLAGGRSDRFACADHIFTPALSEEFQASDLLRFARQFPNLYFAGHQGREGRFARASVHRNRDETIQSLSMGSDTTLCAEDISSRARLEVGRSVSLPGQPQLPDADSRYEDLREAARDVKFGSERMIEETSALDFRVQIVVADTMELGLRINEVVEEVDGIKQRRLGSGAR